MRRGKKKIYAEISITPGWKLRKKILKQTFLRVPLYAVVGFSVYHHFKGIYVNNFFLPPHHHHRIKIIPRRFLPAP